MKKFLSTVWGDIVLNRVQVSDPVSLMCRGDLSGEELLKRLHLHCVNRDLYSFVLSCPFFIVSNDTLCLISLLTDGAEAVTMAQNGLNELHTPNFRHFLWFALQYPDLCLETKVIFPRLWDGNIVTLCPNNRSPLLCCTSPDRRLFESDTAVLAIGASQVVGM